MSNDVQKVTAEQSRRLVTERTAGNATTSATGSNIPVGNNTNTEQDLNKGVTLEHNIEFSDQEYYQLNKYVGMDDVEKLIDGTYTEADLKIIKGKLNVQIQNLYEQNAEVTNNINALINKVNALAIALQDNPEESPQGEETNASLEGASRKTLKELINAGLREDATEKDKELARQAKIALDNTPLEYYTPKEELDPVRRIMADAAVANSGSDEPLYKNKKAQKELKKMMKNINTAIADNLDQAIKEAKDPEVKAALQDYQKKLKDVNLSNKQAKFMAEDIIIRDRVEHTIVLDSYKEIREAKRKLGDEADDYRIVHHSDRYKKKNTEMQGIMAENEGMSTHEAVYRQYSQMGKRRLRISGDGTFERSEVKAAKAKSNSTYMASRKETRRLGYKVDDGLEAAIAIPIAVGALGAGIAAFLGPVGTATATAVATALQPVVGGVLAKTQTVVAKESINLAPYSALVGGLLGAGITAAAFGSKGEEDDILKNLDREYLFEKNGDTSNFENDKLSKEVKSVLREIDKLDITNKQKAKLLTDAAGSGVPNKLSAKELVNALVNAKLGVIPEDESEQNNDDNPCPDIEELNEKDKKIKELEDQIKELKNEKTPPVIIKKDRRTYTPTYVTEDITNEVKVRTVKTIPYGGPWHYSKFYRVDGKEIVYNSPEYKAIVNKLNNGDMMEANGRKDRVLSETIDLGNGKVATLLPQADVDRIWPTLRGTPGGKDVRYKLYTSASGITVLYKVKHDGSKVEIDRGDKTTMEEKCKKLNAEAKPEEIPEEEDK